MKSKPYTPKPHTTTIGSKFEATRGMDAAEVAKLVRADIKAAIASGELPAGAYAVRSSTSQLEIAVSISNVCEPDFVLYNAARLAWSQANPYASLSTAPVELLALYSVRAEAVRATVEAILASYNRTVRSNEADDYGHSHLSTTVGFGGSWSTFMREREEATCALATSPTLPAPEMPANDVDAVLACVLAEDIAEATQADYLAHLGAN